jgi:hypothetical protein
MIRLISIFALSLLSVSAYGQLTIGNGHHVLEITGGISTYYNHRVIKPDATNQNKNKDRFRLRDAQLQLEGRYKNLIEYELQVDFVDLASFSSGIVDPENPGLMDAYFIYKGLNFVDIQVGYGKLYYSRSSLVPFIYSPYWQRAQLVRGDMFSRRDVGVTLMRDFWRQQINIYAGVYTGLGELSLRGDNDASGQPEFAGRIDFAYPARYRYRDIDDKVSPIPMFMVGVNGRYANKELPQGVGFPSFSTGEFGLKVVNGEKYTYGMDASFQFMGFSAQFEIHQLLMYPVRPNDQLFQGIPAAQHEGYVLAGGWLSQINYFHKKWRTIVSMRYEEMDLNDLVPGRSQRLSFAAAYQINGFNSMIKFQYFNILGEEPIDPLRWSEQFRIGWQYNFK